MPKKPIMAPDGGYLLDGDDFVITKDELGRPVISVVGGTTGEVKKIVEEHNDDPNAHEKIDLDGGEL
jgi:hypothetical protein